MKLKLIIALLLFQLGFSQETKMSSKVISTFRLPTKNSWNLQRWSKSILHKSDQINISTLKELNDWLIEGKQEKSEEISKEVGGKTETD
jgi:hypothetical protein